MSDPLAKGVNTFSNDGSFMERFKQLQQNTKHKTEVEKNTKPQLASVTDTSSTKLQSPLAMQRTVPFRISGKSALKPSPTPPAAATAFLLGSHDDGDDESGRGLPYTPPQDPHAGSSSSSRTADVSSTSAASNQYTTGIVGKKSSLSSSSFSSSSKAGVKRKRRSRWGEAPSQEDTVIAQAIESFDKPSTQKLTPEQIRQMIEQQQMDKLAVQVQTAARTLGTSGKKSKYQYDANEDTEEGTWEHKLRMKEMNETLEKAHELTEKGAGKHFIGDFLPPDELERFMEKVQAIKEGRPADLSDYSSHKINEDNVGFQLLQKAGWTAGSGLGVNEDGITAPINKGKLSFDQSGVGEVHPGEVTKKDDEFDVYRKRMMLAYRFRPNPLNNPRRPYY